MNKRGNWVLLVSIGFLILLVIALFLYFTLFKQNNEKLYEAKSIINPVANLSLEEAVNSFNESFIYYFIYEVKAYNLHNPPLSSNKPKINFVIDDKRYNAVITKGNIAVSSGNLDNGDIVIKMSREEAVKILKNKEYIQESFSSGRSEIVLIASKSELFAKGYLNLYNEIIGNDITGNVVRIYLE